MTARPLGPSAWFLVGLSLAANEVFGNLWGMIVEHHAPSAQAFAPFLWVPWAAFAGVALGRLWTANGRPVAPFLAWFGGWLLAYNAALALAFGLVAPAVGPSVAESALALGAGGLTVLGLALSLPRSSRAAAFSIGASALVVSFIGSLALAKDGDIARAWFILLGPLTWLVGFGIAGVLARDPPRRRRSGQAAAA